MSVGYNPKIVTNGLILALDAANIKSYPGTGTTWTDATNISSAVTLQSGVTYNSLNYLTFDGTASGYADFNVSGLTTTVTIEMLVKIKSFTQSMPFGWFAYNVFCYQGRMGFNTGNSDQYGLSSTLVTNLGLLNNWKHYIFEMRSDVSYTNNKIYVNGVSQTLSQVLGAESAANKTFNSGAGRISGWKNNTTYSQSMDLSIFKVYNRSLTQDEINQNFNAVRGRYGI